jgi:hypothetical protein
MRTEFYTKGWIEEYATEEDMVLARYVSQRKFKARVRVLISTSSANPTQGMFDLSLNYGNTLNVRLVVLGQRSEHFDLGVIEGDFIEASLTRYSIPQGPSQGVLIFDVLDPG